MASVSVIVPVFNRRDYLREALESILRQTRPAGEIVVVDDGSTDGSGDVARSFGPPVRCVARANGGIGPARNTGLEAAQGDLIAFLDSDDLWLERKLELQCAFLEAQPETDLVFCRMRPFLSPEIDPDALPRFDESERDAVNSSGLLGRRSAFEAVGPFRGSLGETVEWLGRAREKGLRFGIVPELLLRRRVHQGNAVRDPALGRDYLRLLKRRLDRQRSAAATDR